MAPSGQKQKFVEFGLRRALVSVEQWLWKDRARQEEERGCSGRVRGDQKREIRCQRSGSRSGGLRDVGPGLPEAGHVNQRAGGAGGDEHHGGDKSGAADHRADPRGVGDEHRDGGGVGLSDA